VWRERRLYLFFFFFDFLFDFDFDFVFLFMSPFFIRVVGAPIIIFFITNPFRFDES
jgi:hypothetical protein